MAAARNSSPFFASRSADVPKASRRRAPAESAMRRKSQHAQRLLEAGG
jgi:hypothetical protein